jgi:hypothetical protein
LGTRWRNINLASKGSKIDMSVPEAGASALLELLEGVMPARTRNDGGASRGGGVSDAVEQAAAVGCRSEVVELVKHECEWSAEVGRHVKGALLNELRIVVEGCIAKGLAEEGAELSRNLQESDTLVCVKLTAKSDDAARFRSVVLLEATPGAGGFAAAAGTNEHERLGVFDSAEHLRRNGIVAKQAGGWACDSMLEQSLNCYAVVPKEASLGCR